ncbi:PilZ domain-containing protein [Vibrio ostreicida]|uniref:PilZ domain-containing protein n=1 Tax=Vibrio ostreicida TaxID=526588 RepID=A0ABT8BQK8_9VIBR|nr:PilZ domain-containing protein [Vibrio ostreicida]MDN3609196.1 PilZ domain-containing protein [Vibrio ostreicida]NPD08088.1 PilZ domain-containing protein [Vibrio ostreicida]
MQQPEILSLAERLIPAFRSGDFEYLLAQMTEGEPPSVKILVKMELNRVMAPCTKSVDLRGRVKGDCREYDLDGRKHWLDDVAFNVYHKNTRKFGSYTEGVWEALCNTHNNFRVMQKKGQAQGPDSTDTSAAYNVEAINLGYDLKRREKRLKLSSQIELQINREQIVHATTVDLSPSGAKFKVPAAFSYKLGEIISVRFVELENLTEVEGIDHPVNYRVVGIDDSYENDAVKYLRLLKLDDSMIIEQVIEEQLANEANRSRHDTQDKVIRARTRGYEHAFLKHTCNLPVFFSKNELKLVLMTENNQPIWQYWHDERNQQSLTTLFNKQRLALLSKPGIKSSNNILYSFAHEHQGKTLFFSMMMPETTPETRQLFWHVGAKKESWRAFRLHVFELASEEKLELAKHSTELNFDTKTLTHCGVLQELSTPSTHQDYLLAAKPRLASSELNRFRHARNPDSDPFCIYFDAKSRRKEPRYQFRSPIELKIQGETLHAGVTLDLSKRGISVALSTPCTLNSGEECTVHFKELDLYDKNLPLDNVPYTVIRVSPGGKRMQLVMQEDSHTMKAIAFFGTMIEHNKDKLIAKQELLPSNPLLEGLHDILLDKIVSSPIFVEKRGKNLKPRVIGVNFPLAPHLVILAKLGRDQNFSLEPIYKGHTNTLLAQPMRRIDGAEPQFQEIYFSISQFGNRIQSYESKLVSEFESLKQRIAFVREAQAVNGFFALRICSAPIFDPMTALLQEDLQELAAGNMSQAKNLEKEINSIVGYGEITDITEEVLTRLELTK